MEEQIRTTLDKYLADYIPMQEIIHVSEQLVASPTIDTVHKMMDYLMQPDKEFIYLQTVNVKSVINNQVRLCMADIVKYIEGRVEDSR